MDAFTILVVDDHPLFSAGFAHMAHAMRPNWILDIASSATGAMDILTRGRPDLAIADVGLPDIDGFALLRAALDACPGLPVVMISGRNDAAVRMRARASGAGASGGSSPIKEKVYDLRDVRQW